MQAMQNRLSRDDDTHGRFYGVLTKEIQQYLPEIPPREIQTDRNARNADLPCDRSAAARPGGGLFWNRAIQA
jgi:hypothetical protein